MRFVHGRAGLFDLQEQRIVSTATLEQNQIHLHAHAADADDLTHHVDLGEPVEEHPAVFLEGESVFREELVNQVGLFVVADPDSDRRFFGYPRPAVRHRGELGERAAAGAPFLLLLDIDRDAGLVFRFVVADEAVDADSVVPGVQLRHSRVPAHPFPICLDGRGHRRIGGGRLDVVVARGDDETRRQALDVPLERAGQGLVEVAEIEHQVPLRRRPQAEVEDVRVAAQLHHQPAVRPRREISGHDGGRTPVVVPGRDAPCAGTAGEGARGRG